MAWNGSGTFSRIVTTVSPAVGGTTIDVADQNSYTADVTAGITACLAKNGENAATGDINLGSNQLKAVADGTLATDGVNVGQVQDGSFVYQGTVTGTADAIAMTLTPTLTAYAAGQVFRFVADDTCTGGGVTLNVDGLGAKDVFTNSIADPRAGDISVNGIYTVVYDGTRFLLQNPERETDGVFVNNSDGTPTISGTVIDIPGVSTVTAWESYGPSSAVAWGGSADNEWTALDDVPQGVDWIEVKLQATIAIASGKLLGIELRARKNGSVSVDPESTQIFNIYSSDNDTDAKSLRSTGGGIKIPVDSDVIFDLVYIEYGTLSSDGLDMLLTGYGWN